jgi:hypothetical protein
VRWSRGLHDDVELSPRSRFCISYELAVGLISQTQCGPSGSFAVARHSIGSMNEASVFGRERSFASAIRFAGTVQGVYRLGDDGPKIL